ncbi:hypothetical protein RhiirA5_459006 [Rhizophagus irregularis]|uniref:Uncharacterized protein n=1 Tax=Rhizophagus irregularis TaxID=588596 RepID=A0A2I1DRQ1_9GLOM|nr:hypothetical protein RhiirA5_459006 [Rhizophagus irregularis]PKY12537.1 hypothetical protein RhiirB3_424215 [Rhizophagus irregularis]CAB5189182.1 unnamed protein product [Rhizophagus irregularis]CAB5362294.1 unnamed protein product [Rhizophagus irregularis]CAB5396001.1 unnamed protein product [Rhizophagus irregularis]
MKTSIVITCSRNYEYMNILLLFELGEINILEEMIKNADPNLSGLDEYHKREKEYLLRPKEFEEITTKCDECKKEYDRLRKQRLEDFMHGFTLISQKLKEMYQVVITIALFISYIFVD